MAAVDSSMDFSFADASVDSSFDMENFDPQKKAPKGGKAGAKKAAAKPAAKKAAKGGKTIEETYQKKTQLEHILLRPDTYIGSTESVTQPMFVLDAATNRIVQKDVAYTP